MDHRIVIVGAGFAGLSAAIQLPTRCDVTVISDRPWCEFLPNIHELVSAQKRAADLRLDSRRRIQRAGHRFIQDEVVEVDPVRRCVRGIASGTHHYDALILAIGGVNATNGVAGAERWAMPFKTVDDCERIGARLRELGRAAGIPRVSIVGGGLEGVEALGEILRAFPRFGIHVVEAGPRLLASGPPSLDRTIREESEKFDVTVAVGSRVEAVEPERVTLTSGESIDSDVTIWTGGPTGAPLLSAAGLAPRAGAWAPVAATLESCEAEGVFVAGDAATLGAPIAKQAYHAIDMGVCAAENAMRRLEGETLVPFVPAEKPVLVSFGNLGCFLVVGRWAAFGPAISLAKEAVFQLVSAQLAPPIGVGPTVAAVERFRGSFPQPGWPSLGSLWGGLAGAFDLRVLAPDEGLRR